MCVAVISHVCYIRIVNDITDFNTCLFSVSVFFFLLFYFGIVCVRLCVSVFVCLHDYIVTKCFNSCEKSCLLDMDCK